MLLNMPKLSKKLKKLKKEGGPQFLSLTCYCIRVNGPPLISGSQIQHLKSSGQISDLKSSVQIPDLKSSGQIPDLKSSGQIDRYSILKSIPKSTKYLKVTKC